MKIKIWILFVVLFFSSLPSLYSQQDNKPPVRIMVLTDVVIPNKADQYEQAQKDMNVFLANNFPSLNWQCIQSDKYEYHYIVDLKSYGDIDAFDKSFADKMKSVNQTDYKKLTDAFLGTISSTASRIYTLDEKDSYTAKEPLVQPKDAKFLHFDYYELTPGKEEEALSVAHDISALNQKLNVKTSSRIWRQNYGENNNAILVVRSDKSSADFYSNMEKNNQISTQEKKDLQKKFMAYVQKFDHWNGKMRPELSITEEKAAAK
jgi:antibiotic biosynthesis monooxygenase (ABM) superfamily enzyme